MACAESGERFRWVCSLAANLARPDLSRADNSAPLKGSVLRRRHQVLIAQVDRQRHRYRSDLRSRLGGDVPVNAMGLLRVSAEGEHYGLDLHEHGISAYPEYVISSLAAPGGMIPPASNKLSPEGGVRMAVPEPAPRMP